MQGQISLHLYLKNTLRQGYCKKIHFGKDTANAFSQGYTQHLLKNVMMIWATSKRFSSPQTISSHLSRLSRSSRPGRSSQPNHSKNIGGIVLGIIIYKQILYLYHFETQGFQDPIHLATWPQFDPCWAASSNRCVCTGCKRWSPVVLPAFLRRISRVWSQPVLSACLSYVDPRPVQVEA
jgi:hypothetical protein